MNVPVLLKSCSNGASEMVSQGTESTDSQDDRDSQAGAVRYICVPCRNAWVCACFWH